MFAVDMFAGGARGWDIHDHEFGLTTAGYEYDATACATSAAAGFVTVRGDIRKLDPPPGADGAKGSPPCQTFSASGNGSGRRQLDAVFTAMDQLWETGRLDYDHFEDERTGLVLEPLRWAMLSNWRWLVLEQVPPVLPVWERMAKYLEQMGFSTWTGNLHSEQYGVPQTRKRAILIASRDREVGMPAPTHSKYYSRNPAKLDAGVPKWVSMAEALGYTGFVQEAQTGMGALARQGRTTRPIRTADQPSFTITGAGEDHTGKMGGCARLRMISNYGTGGDPSARGERTIDQPAPTVTSKIDRNKWVYRGSNQAHAARRPLTSPAPTVKFAGRANKVEWMPEASGVRVTVEEAAILQSFPADHPWQGSKTKQYQQVGNAIPPLLAWAILQQVL